MLVKVTKERKNKTTAERLQAGKDVYCEEKTSGSKMDQVANINHPVAPEVDPSMSIAEGWYPGRIQKTDPR